jgi:hypothetical protein
MLDEKVLDLVMCALVNYKPVQDDKLIPPRVLLYHGQIVNGQLLSVHLHDDELVLEDLSGNTDFPLASLNICNPRCTENLQQAVHKAISRNCNAYTSERADVLIGGLDQTD